MADQSTTRDRPGTLVLLIGLRGSGKSTLAERLAASLGYAAVDLDDRTSATLGCINAATAWKQHGQPAFRAAEAQALGDLLKQERTVAALGGGTPTAPGAAELLRLAKLNGKATLVYLRASAAELRLRLEQTDVSSRPPVLGTDPLAEIGSLLAQRGPLYESLADIVIDVDGQTIEQSANAVLQQLTLA